MFYGSYLLRWDILISSFQRPFFLLLRSLSIFLSLSFSIQKVNRSLVYSQFWHEIDCVYSRSIIESKQVPAYAVRCSHLTAIYSYLAVVCVYETHAIANDAISCTFIRTFVLSSFSPSYFLSYSCSISMCWFWFDFRMDDNEM